MNDDQIIIQGWDQGGEEFLALKLKKVFCLLETPQEVEMHNDMIRDIQIMTADFEGDNQSLTVRKAVARILLSRPRKFLHSVANTIIQLSIRNVSDQKGKN